MTQLERCAEHLSLSTEDGQRLLDAIRCAHFSMIAAMTAALNGSAGLGALRPKSRSKVLAALNTGGVAFVEETMSYDQLLTAVQTKDAMEWSPPLNLSEDELMLPEA